VKLTDPGETRVNADPDPGRAKTGQDPTPDLGSTTTYCVDRKPTITGKITIPTPEPIDRLTIRDPSKRFLGELKATKRARLGEDNQNSLSESQPKCENP